jgi:hypothetical protein
VKEAVRAHGPRTVHAVYDVPGQALDALAAELHKLPVTVHVQLNVDPHGIVLSLLGGPASSDVWPAAIAIMRAALPFAAAANAFACAA